MADPKPARAEPSHAEWARTLAASRGEGALSTIARDPAGYPFGSYVAYAMLDANPVLLISRLAEHTQNLEANPRASLLVVEADHVGKTAVARGRATLLGTCRLVEDRARAQSVYLARHPDAKVYSAFSDFAYWELVVESVRFVGGFGRMSWIDAGTWVKAEIDPLLEAVPGILAHMNEDHADACVAYARAFGGVDETCAARMTGVDRYGFEIEAETELGPRHVRIAFPAPLTNADEVRKKLVGMLREARGKLA